MLISFAPCSVVAAKVRILRELTKKKGEKVIIRRKKGQRKEENEGKDAPRDHFFLKKFFKYEATKGVSTKCQSRKSIGPKSCAE